MIQLNHIDNGQAFDFGKTSSDYSRYRDVYPPSFYEALLFMGIGQKEQTILDLGTGSGVIPRNMYSHGAHFVGSDISMDQILEAKRLAAEGEMNIDFMVCPADRIPFDNQYFDGVTACQCFWYFDRSTVIPEIHRVLKPGGKLAVMSMIGLPKESEILAKSEELVLKYNPNWASAGWERSAICTPEWMGDLFTVQTLHTYVEEVEFTLDSWCGRMRSCRGVGASLPPEAVDDYDREHKQVLGKMTDERFTIPHQMMFTVVEAR